MRTCCVSLETEHHQPDCIRTRIQPSSDTRIQPSTDQLSTGFIKKAPEINPKTRPSRDEVMMQVAQTIASRSTCGRLQVGAIISREGRILSTGYNGVPARLPHCQHDLDEPCARAVHAEANAVAFAARHGIATEDAELFTTHDPCLNCAMLIINCGIRAVRSAIRYRDQSGVELLKDARVMVMQQPGNWTMRTRSK